MCPILVRACTSEALPAAVVCRGIGQRKGEDVMHPRLVPVLIFPAETLWYHISFTERARRKRRLGSVLAIPPDFDIAKLPELMRKS